jgi:hypothetical protein
MSDKYKIEIDPVLPSDEKIAESMDFSKIMKQASVVHNPLNLRKKMHRKRMFLMFVVCAIAVALAMVFSK